MTQKFQRRLIKVPKEFEYSDPTLNFWDEYIRADVLERRALVQEKILKAPVWLELLRDIKLPEQLKLYIVSSLLHSYFDDLIENQLNKND